ncbi:unnamed protein product, partial [Mesorhabditis belari]|uniref:CUB domain-containing protein n=1 Tax=Mesorhabditis belari TaxID=2138241 RepID=A0AAF3ELT6_9BILA
MKEILLILFSLSFAKGKIYELDEENPSFAIHGWSIGQEKVEINVKDDISTTLILDFSKIDCLDNADNYLSESSLFSVCFDPIPFTINENTLNSGMCTETLPYDWEFKHSLIICSLNISSPITIEIGKNVINYDFAISVRVRKWTDASKKALPIPMFAINDFFYNVLIDGNTVAQMVMDPRSYKDSQGPFFQFAPTVEASRLHPGSVQSNQDHICELYQIDFTCTKESTYSMNFGPMLGLKKKDGQSFIVGHSPNSDTRSIQARSNVVSISSRDNCSFCLAFSSTQNWPGQTTFFEMQLGDGTKLKNVVQSYGYPSFKGVDDEVKRSLIILATYKNMMYNVMQSEVEIISMKGGNLTVKKLYTYSSADKSDFGCGRPDPLEMVNLTSDCEHYKFNITKGCIRLEWSPNSASDTTAGFLLTVTPGIINVLGDAWRLACSANRNFTLSTNDPPFALNQETLCSAMGDENGPICLSAESSCENCSLLFDIVIECPLITSVTLQNPIQKCSPNPMFPYILNPDYPLLENCTEEYLQTKINDQILNRTFQRCQLIIESSVVLLMTSTYRDIQKKTFFTVRLLESLVTETDDYRLQPMPFDYHNRSQLQWFGYKKKPSTKPTWLTLIWNPEIDYNFKFLERLYTDHNAQVCEYKLLPGNPSKTKEPLITFRQFSC